MFILGLLIVLSLIFGWKKGLMMVLGGTLLFFIGCGILCAGLWFMFTR